MASPAQFFFFLSCVGKADLIHITPTLIHALSLSVMTLIAMRKKTAWKMLNC